MDNEERIEQGANCRHSRNPFVEGVSERTYTDRQLEHIDDGLGCTYDGVDYTAYQATQMQRRIERSIRKILRSLKRAMDAHLRSTFSPPAARNPVETNRFPAPFVEFCR